MTTQTSPAATRLSLLARAGRRDAIAWRELVDLYGPLMALCPAQSRLSETSKTSGRIQMRHRLCYNARSFLVLETFVKRVFDLRDPDPRRRYKAHALTA